VAWVLWRSFIRGFAFRNLRVPQCRIISSQYKNVIALSIFLIVLLVRPTGILGHPEIERFEDGKKNYAAILLVSATIFLFPMFTQKQYFLSTMIFIALNGITCMGLVVLMVIRARYHWAMQHS
jgi:hypothetical protein